MVQGLAFLEAHNLRYGNLSLVNVWVSKVGKVMIGTVPLFPPRQLSVTELFR